MGVVGGGVQLCWVEIASLSQGKEDVSWRM